MMKYKLIIILFVLFPVVAMSATTVKLKSSVTGDNPFTFGVFFKKGDVSSTFSTDLTNYQTVIKKQWNDGSVKHAIVSGHTSFTANTEKTVNIFFSGSAPSGANLTSSDIVTANPSASIQFGSIGTVSLGSLLAYPARTWISGPEMVECHYHSTVGASTSLSAWFYVRLYKSGKIYIRAIADNSQVDVGLSAVSYAPTVMIGGLTVYNNGGDSLTHSAYARWYADGWIGTSAPEIKVKHDIEYMPETRLVPNYWKKNPSAAALSGLFQTYIPLQRGPWKESMGDTGYASGIGILPLWDALYVTSGDAMAYNAVIAGAESLNSYGIVRRSYIDGAVARVSDYPNIVGGYNNVTTSAGTWNDSHHGSGGYLAYLITGDYYYLDVLLDQALLCIFSEWVGNGTGYNRIMKGQKRQHAWKTRTLLQAAAIAPPSDQASDIITLLSANMDYWKTVIDGIDPKGIGYYYEYNMDGTGEVSPWENDFIVASLGHGANIDPLPNMEHYNIVKNYAYKGIAGRIGDISGFCYTYAADYRIIATSSSNTNMDEWFKTWADVFSATHPGVSSCGNTLLGDSGGAPSAAPQMGRWGIALTAIAIAASDNHVDSVASWNRLMAASNLSDLENSGFDDVPQWGIYILNGDTHPQGKRYPYKSITDN